MRRGHRCVLIAGILLLTVGALAGEPAVTPDEELTSEQKAKLKEAYELLGVRAYDKIQELHRLIHEVGVANFLKPYMDDEAKLLDVVQELMFGSGSVDTSMTRADEATYLLKDKRPAVRDVAVKHVTRLALYCDKPYVSNVLYEMYKEAGDDAELRVRLAKAFCLTGSRDLQRREPDVRPPLTKEDLDTAYRRFQEMFHDPDPRVRRTVVENINKTRPVMHACGIGVLENDPDPGVRAALIDYYIHTKIKTPRVIAMGLRGLKSDDIEELENSARYCVAMKLDEAREPMLAVVKRYAEDAGGEEETARIQRLKLYIMDSAIQLGWKKATPDLLWIVDHDNDWRIKNRAAFVVMKLAGHDTVRLGTTDEVFPPNMIEAEAGPLMTAFKAWLIRDQQGQGETPEVKRLEEEAQIAFSEKVYEIAKQRLFDPDVANRRRGLRLIMDLGPEEFAKELTDPADVSRLFGLVQLFARMHPDVESGRRFARVLLAFVHREDKATKLGALNALREVAPFCDKDTFLPVLAGLLQDQDQQVVETVKKTGNAIQRAGYSSNAERQKGTRGYQEEASTPGKH